MLESISILRVVGGGSGGPSNFIVEVNQAV